MTARMSVFQNSPMMAQGQARRRRARAARAVPRQGAGRGVRRALRAAGDRRLGAGPPLAARTARSCSTTPASSLKNGKRVLPDGSPITIEFLLDEPAFKPHTSAVHPQSRHPRHRRDARASSIRCNTAPASTISISTSRSNASVFPRRPANSLRTYFTSQAAATKGSQNLAGIADPAVDALVDIIIAAKTRDELTTACRALDRVIRAGRYWVPHWYQAAFRIAYWDVFGWPATRPRYFRGIPETWWYDEAKAAKLEQKG